MFAAKLILLATVLLLLTALPAAAYIGPGAGLGTIAAVLGILASVVMAFFAILWYPVKRIARRFRGASDRPDRLKPDGGASSTTDG